MGARRYCLPKMKSVYEPWRGRSSKIWDIGCSKLRMEWVKISREFGGGIDLVVTDLLMPIMRGDAAVASIRRDRPNIKVLYISGSVEDLAEAAEVLHKPFKFTELGRRVRSVLDSESELKKPA